MVLGTVLVADPPVSTAAGRDMKGATMDGQVTGIIGRPGRLTIFTERIDTSISGSVALIGRATDERERAIFSVAERAMLCRFRFRVLGRSVYASLPGHTVQA
jgi:hypothetical protein